MGHLLFLFPSFDYLICKIALGMIGVLSVFSWIYVVSSKHSKFWI